MPRRKIRGFTLVEVLVVISIIALLVSILLPALGRTKEQARQTQCVNQVRQLAIACQMYAQDNHERMAWLTMDPNNNNHWAKQGNQIPMLQRYLSGRGVFTCPNAVAANSGGWAYPPFYEATVAGETVYTDYKVTDNENALKQATSQIRLPRWLVVAVDIDWGWPPRHGEGENLGFLDGHAQWLDRTHYNVSGPLASDPNGNTPWYNWGL